MVDFLNLSHHRPCSAWNHKPVSESSSLSVSNPASHPPTPSSSSAFTSHHLSTTLTSFSAISYPTNLSTLASTITTHTHSNAPSSAASSATPSIVAAQANTVCIGHGLDISATGLIATVVLPSAIGLILWLVFAIIRPRFRQLYAVREWFVQQDLRPQPLPSTLWAFLFPRVPMVPSLPKDVSRAGRSVAEDVELFPSDEQLTQRTLWFAFLLALGWTILGLAGALPIYLISTPCLAHLPPRAKYTGALSTLQDLSLLRLLRFWDSEHESVTSVSALQHRAPFVENDARSNLRIRFILLTILVGLIAVGPALYKILKQFNHLVAYRQRWVTVRCQENEMGWLSARNAPGFANWGEQHFKDFILKTGLSSSFENSSARNGSRRRPDQRRLTYGGDEPKNTEGGNLEIDIQSLFSIGDTHQLALLIDERDEILENLEIAETKYISSFRLTTPDPSIADFQPHPPPEQLARPYISRPRALKGNAATRRRRRAYNPAYAASSLAPTSFVAPSQYYKLRNVRGVSGGRFVDGEEQPSLTDSVYSRVVGSRFQEVNRDSTFGRLALGSRVPQEDAGPLVSSQPYHLPDPAYYVPNFTLDPAVVNEADEFGIRYRESGGDDEYNHEHPGEEWVDLSQDDTGEKSEEPQLAPTNTIPTVRRRPKKEISISTGRRETFPLRNGANGHSENEVPPPHLRLQTQGPFVRPLSGLNHNDLGDVYGDISQWRTKLKSINAEIADAQRDCYIDIAEGTGIKGWLMVGRGLRFIPGIQLIEGRAKEDIRWDVLQNERTAWDSVALWTVVGFITILLAIFLTAAAGLALSPALDVVHTFPFLRALVMHDNLASGIATTLVPATLAVLSIVITVAVVHWAADIRGSVSISSGHLVVFKAIFLILSVVATVDLVIVGSLLFAIQSFDLPNQAPAAVADGAIYISALLLTMLITVAIILPALLMLQPRRLLHILRAEKYAVTPRQRFRAIYPRPYNPSFAIGACVLAVIFASTFSLIFPLIGPPVVVFLFLTLIAHRYLVGYVYARTHSQTGGLLQIWLLRRFGTLLSLQPILLGLIFLSRKFWIEGGALVGVGTIVIAFVETYTHWKTKLPGRSSLSTVIQNSLNTFASAAKQANGGNGDSNSSVSSARLPPRPRGSMASVLEMMSMTLAVMPSPSPQRGPVPLKTETLDDLTATERAARTHPDAPPHLPPLSFTDHAEDMAGILYAPELVAPPPIIWLPNDSAGVARSEAYDLQKYHDLQATLDVWAKEDVLAKRTSLTRTRS